MTKTITSMEGKTVKERGQTEGKLKAPVKEGSGLRGRREALLLLIKRVYVRGGAENRLS